MLGKAIDISFNAHKGQYDKAGKPYASHPIYVACKMKTDKEKIVALLHDVLEDTEITVEYLIQEGYTGEIIEAIIAITRENAEDYFQYIKRVKQNPLAKKVKIEDLKHNMDISRINEPTQRDLERVERYKKALVILRDE
ncbi:MAG: GTP pyrophosphokinase [Gudongella sp.]|nr:GTP pyrophosphokinase [Gudongella sp.]